MMTVLVVLILTIIGIGVAYLTQVEDKFSGNDRTAHSGFYAAEAGLRVGEKLIAAAFSDPSSPTNFQKMLATSGAIATPGGGYSSVPLQLIGVNYQNVPVDPNDSTKGTYSLYVRNNAEDRARSNTKDSDNIINLISVGQAPGGQTKWIEEQLTLGTLSPANAPSQIGGGPGGGGSITE